jgi:hypothetical protein
MMSLCLYSAQLFTDRLVTLGGFALTCAGLLELAIFNIAGNKYRLIVEMQYRARIAWVKFIGTHARYDQINVETVNEY